MRRIWKVTLSFVFFLLSGSLVIWKHFGHRIRADERSFAIDIHTGLSSGRIGDLYLNGKGYQSAMITLLKVIDLPYIALESLSPLLGTVAAACLIVVLIKLYVQSVDDFSWWEPLPVLLAIPALPGMANRLRESSHKAYTFVLVGLSIYLAVQMLRGRRDRRFVVLVGIFLTTLAFINWIWAGIYGGYVGVLLIGGVSVGTVFILGAVTAGAIVVALVSPSANANNFMFFRTSIQFILDYIGQNSIIQKNISNNISSEGVRPSQIDRSRGSVGKAVRRINAWGEIRLGPLRISKWALAWSSVLFAGATTAITDLSALVDARKSGIHPMMKLVLVTSFVFGALLVGSILGGSIATAKRLIVFPGIFGILYAALMLSGEQTYGQMLPDIVKTHRRSLLVIFTVGLGATVAVGATRMMLNGVISPWDFYASPSQVAKIEWLGHFDGGCLAGTDFGDNILSAELLGENTGWREIDPATSNVVFDSGESGKLICER